MVRSGLSHICPNLSGTHLCHFYQTSQDLLEVQVPFFRCGLQDNERCIWMVCNPLTPEQAKAALEVAVPDLDDHLETGQIEIADGYEYYSKTIKLNAEQLSQLWISHHEEAQARGYSGLRLSGNVLAPFDEELWKTLLSYDMLADEFILKHRAIALCCYGLQTPQLGHFMDVFALHEMALIRRNGHWQAIKNHSHARKAAEPVGQDRLSLLDAERAARTRAEHLNRIKDDFLATVSHELRSPLAAILGWTRMVRRGADEQEIKHGLEIVEQNAAVLAQLVEDLLDVSRIISGKIRLQCSSIEPETFIRTVVNSLQLAANNKNLVLEREIPYGLRCIRCDPIRIRQVLWNLLTNAIKFTPQGGHIWVRARQDDCWLTIEVADTGEGISQEFLPRIFDKFQQADPVVGQRHGGLGLGLAIIKHIVELHGGTIEAASDGLGKGATFTVRLPFSSPLSANEETAAAPGDDDTDIMLPDGLVTLLVDDDAEACELIGRVMRESGAYVLKARSAAEAWAILSHCCPDVIISDISMPDEDGYSLVKRIRSADSKCNNLPCIALSSLARPEDHDQALAAGFDEHLSKFTEPMELIRSIRAVLRKKKHSRADEPVRKSSPNRICQVADPRQTLAHVLVAEDDPTTSELLRITLEQVGYRVSVADTINEGLAIADHQPVDVLIADLRLKDGTGIDLMMQLRKDRHMAGIMTSGYSDEMHKLKSKAAGFDEYLVKPIDTDHLCELIAKMITPLPITT